MTGVDMPREVDGGFAAIITDRRPPITIITVSGRIDPADLILAEIVSLKPHREEQIIETILAMQTMMARLLPARVPTNVSCWALIQSLMPSALQIKKDTMARCYQRHKRPLKKQSGGVTITSNPSLGQAPSKA